MNSERVLSWDTLAPAARLQLLGNSFMRVRDGCTVMPLLGLPGAIWLYSLGLQPSGIPWWWLAALLLTAAAWGLWIWWQRDLLRQGGGEVSPKFVAGWLRRVQMLAAVYGAVLMSVVASAGPDTPFELRVVFICGSTLVVSAHAAHQSAALVVFKRFFFTSYAVSLLSVPYVFPDHWKYLLPMHLAFGVFFRNARISHQFFLSNVDLTERFRAAKGEAEQALAVKNQFLATASHDLRQPVHAVGLLAESIVLRNRDPALDATLQNLRQGVQSLQWMCNALLDLSRIEAGAVQARSQAVALAPLLREVAMLLGESARTRGLVLRLRPPPASARVQADPMLLRQCVVNLVHNALQYTQRGGVLLAVRRRAGHWQVEVWDTGPGVAAEERERIFSPFTRSAATRATDDAGYGLGLAVVARCAELMNAPLGLVSRLGHGSRFWLRLPQAASSEVAIAAPPASAWRGGLQGRCLVVDDDPQVAAGWQQLLQDWGVQVRCAADGAEALGWLAQGFMPQAILCDERLRSGESGFALLQRLQALCPDAALAMVSGEWDSPALRQAEDEGYLVLRKPVAPDQLHTLLRQWLPEESGLLSKI
ncbi:ATP-binding protein [Acidovorax sp. D2M1]|uniref:histidine kinase n=1 Tax=Acidovorax benzenivorans TaxID=2987520 RepID=A0ABT5RVV7_9BURK|nr:hybrid sensor histidine kinase/response regulator [Acidovorax benzenivorans]MDD2177834.1 ATP-binding protein [Acidovorax benzenivorans]